jgi:hypothetical protein
MATATVPETLEDFYREFLELRAEVEALKAREVGPADRIRRFAGCFTGDEDWAAIHEAIEERRRQPAADEDES